MWSPSKCLRPFVSAVLKFQCCVVPLRTHRAQTTRTAPLPWHYFVTTSNSQPPRLRTRVVKHVQQKGVWCEKKDEYFMSSILHTYGNIYVYVKIDKYMSLSVINTYIYAFVYMYKCLAMSYELMIFERIRWSKKMPKIHAKSLYDALALPQKDLLNLCLRQPCRANGFASVVVDLHLWKRRSTRLGLISVRLV